MFLNSTDPAKNIKLSKKPKRIISVVPSQTELLFDLGLDKEVIGITKFCVHPNKWFSEKARVGGTKTLQLSKIRSLKPDLILANKEENTKEDIEELAADFPVWVSDISTIEDAYAMIGAVGDLTGKGKQAESLLKEIKTEFSKLQLQNSENKLRTCYLIWKTPYMAASGETFIGSMLKAAGFNNIFHHHQRYPEITVNDLQKANCELLLLSSEPYPFKEKHVGELQGYLPETKIVLTDGEMFSWYGSRMLQAAKYFTNLRRQIEMML